MICKVFHSRKPFYEPSLHSLDRVYIFNKRRVPTTEQYSSIGLTYTLKAVINDDTFLE